MYKLDKCPYCGANISLKQNNVIYGQKYGSGWVYICNNYPECDSYVGTHKDKNKTPLGRLADKELRGTKTIAHLFFDSLWTYKKIKYKDLKARKKGYEWLSKQMNKKINDTHIGYFDLEETEKVIEICKPYLKNLLRKKDEILTIELKRKIKIYLEEF